MLASDRLTSVLWCAIFFQGGLAVKYAMKMISTEVQNMKAKEPKPTKTLTKQLNTLLNNKKKRKILTIFVFSQN